MPIHSSITVCLKVSRCKCCNADGNGSEQKLLVVKGIPSVVRVVNGTSFCSSKLVCSLTQRAAESTGHFNFNGQDSYFAKRNGRCCVGRKWLLIIKIFV